VTTDPLGAKSLRAFDLLGPTTHSIANNIGNSAVVPDNLVVVIAPRYCLSRRNNGRPAGRPHGFCPIDACCFSLLEILTEEISDAIAGAMASLFEAHDFSILKHDEEGIARHGHPVEHGRMGQLVLGDRLAVPR